MSSADGRPRRRGPIALLLAWLAVLTAGAGIAAYAVVTGPPTRPVEDRPQLSMSLADPPAPQQSDTPKEAGSSDAASAPNAGPSGSGSGDDDGPQAAGSQDPADPAADPDNAAGSGDSATARAGDADPSGASEPASDADAPAGTGQQPSGVAANIPQPPTPGGAPTSLLGNGTNAAAERQQDGDEQTASRGGEAAKATPEPDAPPQLPVSDPDAPAWKRYAQRMTPPQGVPKIAVIVRGLGLSSAAAKTAVSQLPASVSLAFTPYARERAKAWAAEARRNGHEVLVDLPMEPADYPATDPGPRAIMSDITARANLQRLDWLLAQVDREVGAVAQMGGAVLTDAQVAEPLLRGLKNRGLMFVDNGAIQDSVVREIAQRMDLPFAVNDRTLDGGQVSRRAIESRLVEAERLAREQGLAVVMAHPYPVSLELLVSWTGELEARGFVLVPATYAAIERAGQNAAQLR